jgi:NitT/TauT family transport system ATP-binding protein
MTATPSSSTNGIAQQPIVTTDAAGEVLLAAQNIDKFYGDDKTPVLDKINLDLRAGEFVALLGPSGSGKSTLLRILAGLMRPSSGEVLVHGSPLNGSNPQVAVVFQSFALFPWLTVLHNVELGLAATGVPEEERRPRALKAIDLIGLDGYEEAFPKELSGGMKQRVGFARALVVQPEVLFMDEPFSALDILTGENLRAELQELWADHTIPTKAVLMVTHNIEEAVVLADRILVFGANPGRIRIELRGLPLTERTRKSAARQQLVDTIYRIMTNPNEDAVTLAEQHPFRPGLIGATSRHPERRPRYQVLPDVGIDDLTGFVQYLSTIGERANVHDLARDLQLRVDDVLSIVEASDLLGFADLQDRAVVLTDIGRRFAEADLDEEKAIFRVHALAHVSLLRHIVRDLDAAPSHSIDADRVIEDLEDAFSSEEARRQFETVVDWGRYAELFAYDDTTGELRLDEETGRAAARTMRDGATADVTDGGEEW